MLVPEFGEKKKCFHDFIFRLSPIALLFLIPSLILINLTQPEPRNNLKFDSPPSLIFSTTTYRNSLTSSSFEGKEGGKGGRIFPHPAFVASRWPRSTGRTGMRACYAHMHVGWRFGQVWRLDSTRLDQRADAHAHRCASARHTGPRQGPRAASRTYTHHHRSL